MALKIDRDASMGDINVWRGEFEPARNAANAVFLFHPLSILDAKFAFSDQRSKKFVERFHQTYLQKGTVSDFIRAPLEKLNLEVLGRYKLKSGDKRCEVAIMLIGMLPWEMTKDPAKANSNIFRAAEKAKAMGANLVGCGGFTSITTTNGSRLLRKKITNVTPGGGGTTVGAVWQILDLCSRADIDLSESTMSIVGAGSVGTLVCKSLASKFGRIAISSRTNSVAESLADELVEELGIDRSTITLAKDNNEAVRLGDVVVLATSASSPEELQIDPISFRNGAIVVDIGRPANFAWEWMIKEKNDPTQPIQIRNLLPFDAAILNVPGRTDRKTAKILQLGGVRRGLGCFSETCLWALEGASSSRGVLKQDQNISYVNEVEAGFRKHGFSLASLRAFNAPVSIRVIKSFCKLRKGRGDHRLLPSFPQMKLGLDGLF